MRIPDGNFGNTQQHTIPGAQVVNTNEAATRATQRLGNTLQNVGLSLRQDQIDKARIKGTTALAEYDLHSKQSALNIQQRVQNGELNYKEAEAALDNELTDYEFPKLDGADERTLADFKTGADRLRANNKMGMQEFVFGKEQEDFKGQFVQFLDTQGKLAGLPGADIGAINESASITAAEMARKAGIPAAQSSKYIQDLQDRNWFNNATQRVLANRNNLEGLRALESELTAADGFYSNKLDTEKRNALTANVMNVRTQLENKIQLQSDRREVKAERAIMEMERQISTGYPATPEQMTKWGALTKGTAFESDYGAHIKAEQVVQEVLRKPIDQQASYVQQEQARLQQNGGDHSDIANINRLSNAVQTNIKQLRETPLLYAQARTGDQVEPIDISLLGQDGGIELLAAQMSSRTDTLGALKQQYGDQVEMRPLLPQEAQFLTSTLQKVSPQEQAKIFNGLATVINDKEAYRGVMQQIAPDSPIKAMAGVLMGYTGAQTLETHWIGNDDAITAQKAATTMLAGENIINRTAADGKTDGKPSALPIPSDKDFSAEFSAEVGDVFAGRPQAMQTAMQAARAHYVGSMSESGDFSNEIDSKRVRDSVRATLGEPVKYKNSTVLLPWGMDESTFRDQFRVNLGTALKDRGLSTDQVNAEIVKFPRMDLMNFGDGEYLVMDGARRPYIVNGQPVTVKVGP